MKGILAFSILCVATLAAPPHNKQILPKLDAEVPHPAYQKDMKILPTTDSRIINGQDAARNQFPYQVSWEWGWVTSALYHFCGGSIISARSILSAAHCIMPGGTNRIVAGILNRDENTAARQDRDVSRIVGHYGYYIGDALSPNDIAVIVVASAFTFTTAVSPVRLPSSDVTFSGTAVMSGWGRWNLDNGEYPVTLQFATQTLLTQDECATNLISTLGDTVALDSKQVCTGGGAQGVFACNGDSGGPVVQNGILVGVVSWGPCGIPNAPSVHTRTASFVNWIASNIA